MAYEVLTELGRGDDTIVSKGFDQETGKKVAIKSLAVKWEEADPVRKEQFLREARAQANLFDSHLVDVISVDKQQGWVVMEYMDGSIAEELKGGPLAADRVREVLVSVLQGLRYLHSQGKVHGRVRPTNLLFDEQKRVKLSDFASINDGEELAHPRGDFKYLAPELIDPSWGPIGPATDLYCLGFAALEMLMGARFDSLFGGSGTAVGENRQNTWMRWHASGEQLRPARELVPSIPGDLADAIDSMLVKKVAQRANDCGALLKKLQSGSFAAAPAPMPAPAPVAPPPSAPAYQPLPAAPPADAGGISSVVWILVGVLLLGAVGAVFLLPKGGANQEVAVESDPPGASLGVNGKEPSKKTPAKLSLSPKKHKIRFELEGYEPKEEEIEVVAGKEPPALKVKLTKVEKKVEPVTPPVTPMPQMLTITVESDIQTANVTLADGKKVPFMGGKAIWQQPAADPWPKMTVSAENFEPQTIDAKPAGADDKNATVAVKLKPILKVEPADAAVELAGVGKLPAQPEGKVTLPRSADDKYHLSVKKEGYEPLEKDFTLADLQAAKFSLALTKKAEPPPVTMAEPFGKKLKLRQKIKIDSDLYQVGITPDGSEIYVACRENRVEGFNLKELRRFQIKTDGPVLALAMRPKTTAESNVVFAGGDAEKHVFISRTVPPPSGATSDVFNLMGHNEAVRAVAFHPEANWLASGSADGDIGWWDPEKDESIRPPVKHPNHLQEVRALAFDVDGIWFASAGADNKLHLSTMKGEAKSFKQALGSTVNCLAFDPRGKFLASGDARGWINFWTLEAQAESEGFLAHSLPGEGGAAPSGVAVQRLVYVVDEKGPPLILSAGRDKLVRFWDADKRKASEVPPLAHDGPVLDMAVHFATKRLVTCTQNEVYLWDEVGPQPNETFKE